MSTNPQTPTEGDQAATSTARTPRWIVALLVVLPLLLVYLAYAQHATRGELVAQLEQVHDKLGRLEARSATLEDNYATAQAQIDVNSEKLGVTQKQVSRARSQARQLREEQKRAATELGTQIEQQQEQLGSLTGEVSTVKADVTDTRTVLEETKSQLERTVGDLGLQSGLIARNQEELDELKQRGERDYYEFDIRKSKKYSRVGYVSLRLNKTDTKRQRYTMTVLDNDKRIEKKDKTLLEPVQFYQQGTRRHLLEVVVFEINKNHVVGYMSAPKELARR
ncbi:MAG: hypothetical protein ACE5HB_04335 [Terriglobia bacterium]